MNILLIGNKPSDMKIDYSKYDIICQINRMNNIMNVPKVDMWYCDCHHLFFELPSDIKKSNCDLSNTKILIPYGQLTNVNKLKHKYPNINTQNISPFKQNNKESSKKIGGKHKIKNILTSDVIVLMYLLETYPNDTITLAYLDVYGRGDILTQQDTHKRTWHANAVYDEENYLIKLIEDGRIKYISDNSTIKEKFCKITK